MKPRRKGFFAVKKLPAWMALSLSIAFLIWGMVDELSGLNPTDQGVASFIFGIIAVVTARDKTEDD